MRVSRLTVGILVALAALGASSFPALRLLAQAKIGAPAGGATMAQLNDPKYLIQQLDQRVTELERKLASVQKQVGDAQQHFATHTHTQAGPRCTEYLSVLNFKQAADHPEGHQNLGVCLLNAPSSGVPPSHTTPPDK